MGMLAAVGGAACACALLSAPLQASAQLTLSSASVSLAHSGSSWREKGTDGQPLLSERGELRGLGLSAAVAPSGWGPEGVSADLALAALEGPRAYVGRTNRGQPLQTGVDAAETSIQVTLRRSLTEDISAGMRVSNRHARRDIASTSATLGLREDYRWFEWGAVIEHRAEVTRVQGFRYTLSGEVGRRYPARLTGAFDGGSPFALKTGAGWVARGQIKLSPSGLKWGSVVPWMGIHHEVWAWQAGPDTPVGFSLSARQPSTQGHSTGLAFGLDWR